MACPRPIRLRNNLLLRLNERRQRAHPVFLLGAPADPRERSHAVVDDDTDLGLRLLRTCKY